MKTNPDLLNDLHKLAKRQAQFRHLADVHRFQKLSGYIRRIQCDPFGFSLYSPLQLKAYLIICRKKYKCEVRAHFDGTGQILDMGSSDILKEAGEHLMYSLVLHTDSDDLQFSLMDFLSTAHGQHDISGPLCAFVASALARATPDPELGYPRPAVAVTDQSINCMKAVCQAFNGFSIQVYNAYAWNLVQHELKLAQIRTFTRISHCMAHSMKNASKHMTGVDAAVAKFFMAAFACLIDVVTLAELRRLLSDMILVFGAA